MKDNELFVQSPIITVKEIRKILTDFSIGKKPLSKLLGWGETTIIRYIEGDIPSIAYSDQLKSILSNPNYYYSILQKNKMNITSIAFKRSKTATLNKLMESKINIVAQYIINQYEGDICLSYVHILLYYIQGFSLSLLGVEMFEDDYMITPNDKPYLKIYNAMKLGDVNLLEIIGDRLTEKEILLINHVVESFSWYGMKLFREMRAYEKPLLRISRNNENCKIVAKETIKTYFSDVLVQLNIGTIREIHKYPDKKMIEIKNSNS